MNENYYISDTPLPLAQDFHALKNKGLAFIQEHIGSRWTNFNASDPGITILDQLCFALTELGYCNDFEIKDILTAPNDRLVIKDQFYLPQEILTTSPVTINDYRKYLIDAVNGVDNAIINPQTGKVLSLTRMYHVFLYINSKYDPVSIPGICKAAYFFLNKARNLGELFADPEALTVKGFYVKGIIAIKNESEQYKILQAIQEKINDYIFQGVVPKGFDTLSGGDADIDEILNGPFLTNGYIPAAAPGNKKNKIRAIELSRLINSVPGVISTRGIVFIVNADILPPVTLQEVSCAKNEILFINIAGSRSIPKDGLQITLDGNELPFNPDWIFEQPAIVSPSSEISFVYGTTPGVLDQLPTGKFRDINTYYSIQNTFPEVFAVGPEGPAANASAYERAQARQLKGYLTLMDQVLANQFSQLSNISNLFSFKNSVTGAPSDLNALMALKERFANENSDYPAPYMVFSPTYFYQSLYNIPHIQPLLRNNKAFDYGTYQAQSDKDAEFNSWIAYQEDPYNAYMLGLMQIMREDDPNLERRNDILDHLLARHGESPLLIDAYINGSVYTRNTRQDKVIFKSLYLQNYGLLSYNRQKAYNFLGADEIPGYNRKGQPEKFLSACEEYDQEILEGDSIDFIFNSEKIDLAEKIQPADFINYSAVELKLSLLFGLRTQYRNFIAEKNDKKKKELLYPIHENGPDHIDVDLEISQAKWFIKHRRGFIMIETALLLNQLKVEIFLKECSTEAVPVYYSKKISGSEGPVSFQEALAIHEMLTGTDKRGIHELIEKGSFDFNNKNYNILPAFKWVYREQDFRPINETGYFIFVQPYVPDEYNITLKINRAPENAAGNLIKFYALRYPSHTYLDFNEATGLYKFLYEINQAALDQLIKNGFIEFENKKYEILALDTANFGSEGLKPMNEAGDLIYLEPHWSENTRQTGNPVNLLNFEYNLAFIFPHFIPQFNKPEFWTRLNLFLSNELPVAVHYNPAYNKPLHNPLLAEVINAFCYWHNSLRFQQHGALHELICYLFSFQLIDKLIADSNLFQKQK